LVVGCAVVSAARSQAMGLCVARDDATCDKSPPVVRTSDTETKRQKMLRAAEDRLAQQQPIAKKTKSFKPIDPSIEGAPAAAGASSKRPPSEYEQRNAAAFGARVYDMADRQ